MAAGHNSHSSWFNSLVTLTTRELESQENDYLVQQGIPWYHQQATSAAASPYLASLHGAFTPAIFETPHSPQSSEGESSNCSTAGSTAGSTATSQSRKRTPWMRGEEEILIDLCREHKSAIKGSGSSKTWQEIADRLNKSSEEINVSSSVKTGQQCKDKWHNLLNAYKKAKDSSTKTGGGTKTIKAFKHFEQMDMFMGDKHEITMPFVRNSSQIPADSQDSNSFETHAAVDSEDSSVGSPVNAAVGNLVSSPPSDHCKPSTSGVQLQQTDGSPQSPSKKSKVKKGKSPKKGKGKLMKDEQDDRWCELFEKQTKILEASQKGQEHCFQFLKESEERGRDLLITAIKELGSVLGGQKGRKRKADEKIDSSDED